MIQKYKHVIWDWNGTLLDDIELSVTLINNVLRRRGLAELSLEGYKAIFTFPVKEYYAVAGLDFEHESFEIVGKEWMDEYESRKKECLLSSNAQEVLAKISNVGIQQSILSAYSQNVLIEIVNDFKLTDFFTHVMGLDHIYATGKIELGKSLMKRINLPKDEVVLIGDTIHDFEVANAIGASCILISAGHQNRERLEKCGVPVYDSMTELYKSL